MNHVTVWIARTVNAKQNIGKKPTKIMNKRKILSTFMLLLLVAGMAIGHSEPDKKDKKFTIKGFHLDLRIQVMKLDALKDFADELSSHGINTLIMEWEATFPFESHPVISNQYAYTKEEIADFINYCEKLGIDVVPLQQSLGHLEYVLRYQRYVEMREDLKDVSQICPMEPELNRELMTDLITEMAKAHPSKYIHLGGDEAYLFGNCDKCSAKIEEDGKASLLAQHLKMVTEIAVSLGKTPILWSDVANKYPEQLSQLPKETIFLVWNYGWALDRFGDPGKLTKMGFEVWGAPSLRSNPDNFFLTNWEKHFKNIRDFIPVCRKSDYSGIIMTSWSTSGVYSPVFEDNKRTISELVPIRNVYPISGFSILLNAYGQALDNATPLDIEKFISDYSKKRFGFNSSQSADFWRALKGQPYEVLDGTVDKNKNMTVKMLYDSAKQYQEIMNALQPSDNTEEFEHLRLMTDIRENYLKFKCVEILVNSKTFHPKMLPSTLNDLREIIKKDENISARFTKLNGYLLYAGQIEEENQIRIKRVKALYNRLAKTR